MPTSSDTAKTPPTSNRFNSVMDIPKLFGDSPSSPVLLFERFNAENVLREINESGFSIVKGLLPVERIERIRSYWIDTFTHIKPGGRVTWTPYLGQPNQIGFTNDTFQYLFRSVDFLWNDPYNSDTRDVCLRIHALRNVLIQEDPLFGLRATDGRHGVFITASYYPGGKGRMGTHNDGVASGKRLIHGLVPITFKGKDYKDGGMMVVNRQGQETDVDARLEPGDAVFYDGALNHAVKPVVAFEGRTLGRIQIFPLPAVFGNLENNLLPIARIPVSKFLQGKWLVVKNQIRIRLGLQPAMR